MRYLLLALIVVIVVVFAGLFVGQQILGLNRQIATLNGRINFLEANVSSVASSTALELSQVRQLATRPVATLAPAKTQDQLIREAVAAAAPAVTSIVVSELVPQLQVNYVNPFGNDAGFGDIGIRIPVYERKGSTLQKVGAGTGFLVSSNGYIVTNKHVVDSPNAKYTVLLSNGSQVNATIIYRDPDQDIAIIKIPGTYKNYASLGNSSSLALGQTVIAIGNALGEYNNSVSLGIISGLNRTVTASNIATGKSEDLAGVIQVDAAINPGNSGGPLIDQNGKVVGITVATVLGGNGIGFAIPINSVRDIIETYTP